MVSDRQPINYLQLLEMIILISDFVWVAVVYEKDAPVPTFFEKEDKKDHPDA